MVSYFKMKIINNMLFASALILFNGYSWADEFSGIHGNWKPDIKATINSWPSMESSEIRGVSAQLAEREFVIDAVNHMIKVRVSEHTDIRSFNVLSSSENEFKIKVNDEENARMMVVVVDSNTIKMVVNGMDDRVLYLNRIDHEARAGNINLAKEQIMNNLQNIARAGRQYLIEMGAESVGYNRLVSQRYIREVNPVLGEDYSGLVVKNENGSQLVVKTSDGQVFVHTY